MSRPHEVPSTYNSAHPRDGPLEEDEEDNTPIINDVECLKQGTIKTSKNTVQAPYTILLVGETGVGKTSFLEFIANVLTGRDIDHYDFEILDHANEQGGPDNQSQTNSARLYKFTSKNGIVVRILDTPGLADTRGIERDELHMKNIATEISKHIDSVTAVLILANGTVPRITVGTDYALSTLSATFPKTLVNQIAFMFTNVPSPHSWNFSQESIPDVLGDAHRFLIDNPVALQKKYLRLKDNMNMKKVGASMRKSVQASEERALEVLVELFDWLDGLESQPTTEIVNLYNMAQSIEAMITNTLAQVDQAATKKAGIDKLMGALQNDSTGINIMSHFENTITMPVWRQRHSFTTNMICGQASCYSNCDIDYEANIPLDLKGFFQGMCDKCNHSLWNHHRCRAKWDQVNNIQGSVDQDMKEWEAAKDGKERTAILAAVREKVLSDLNEIVNRATNDLIQLAERYARLSLSGSFSTQVDSAVRLLEQHYAGLENKGVDQDQLQRVKVSLGHMKRKLRLLSNAKASGVEAPGAVTSPGKPGDSESTADLESPRSPPLSFYQSRPVTGGVPILPSSALPTSPLGLASNLALPSQALDTLSESSLRTSPTQSPPLSVPYQNPSRSLAPTPAPPGRATTHESPLLKSLIRRPPLPISSPPPASPLLAPDLQRALDASTEPSTVLTTTFEWSDPCAAPEPATSSSLLAPDLELALDATTEPSTVLTTTFEPSDTCAAPEPATPSGLLAPDLELALDATIEPSTVLTTTIESSDACAAPEPATSPSLFMKLFVWLWAALAVSVPARLVPSTYQPVQGSLASPDSAQNRPQSIPTRDDLQTSLSQSPPSPTPNARPPPQPSMQSPPISVLEMPRELFSDLTKPHNPKDFAVTKFSKKLIEWVGLDIVRIRNNHQVAYHIVDQCREAYERINDIVDEIEQSTDDEIKLSKFLKYMDAVSALEEYCIKLLCTSELETTDYFATTNTIDDCIRGATSWAEHRQNLRDIASEFTANEKLLAVFEPEMKAKFERGLVDAAHDDDAILFGDLRARIEAHRMVNEVTQASYNLHPVVKTFVSETKVAIGTLHEVIAQEADVKKKTQRQMFSIQFLFILHGAMEIVVDTSEIVDDDWKAHLKSQEVWTAAKLLTEYLQKDNIKYEAYDHPYDHFLQVISTAQFSPPGYVF